MAFLFPGIPVLYSGTESEKRLWLEKAAGGGGADGCPTSGLRYNTRREKRVRQRESGWADSWWKSTAGSVSARPPEPAAGIASAFHRRNPETPVKRLMIPIPANYLQSIQ
jgi:hypothetical protein